MSLKFDEEWINQLRRIGKGVDDPDDPLLPGCEVYNVFERNTYGIILSILAEPAGRALVMWSRGLTPRERLEKETVQKMAKQIADEEDTQIFNILRDMHNAFDCEDDS